MFLKYLHIVWTCIRIYFLYYAALLFNIHIYIQFH